jgi:hypothetical protein
VSPASRLALGTLPDAWTADSAPSQRGFQPMINVIFAGATVWAGSELDNVLDL